MYANRHPVNVIPAELPPDRLETLLSQYRERCEHPAPDDAPAWYLHSVIDELEARLNERPLAS